MAYCNAGIDYAVSGFISSANFNISNSWTNMIYSDGKGVATINPFPKSKSFREKLEEEINNWHGNLLQELQSG